MRKNGLLVLLVLSLMLNAFLLGRMSAPKSPTIPPSPTPIAVAISTPPPLPRPEPAPTLSTSPVPEAPPAPATPRSLKIEKYLSQVASLTASTMDLGDPSQFATDLLQQSMLGDTSQLDSLLAQVAQNRQQLQQIEAPADCKEHKRVLLAQLASSQKLLEKLKGALLTSDSAALAGLALEGRQMQQQISRLSQLESQLRRLR